MKKTFFLFVLAPALIFSGCSQDLTSTDPNLTRLKTTSQIDQHPSALLTISSTSTASAATEQAVNEDAPDLPIFAPTLKGQDIYCLDQTVGTFRNGRVYMRLDDKIVSFEPPKLSAYEGSAFDIKDLVCESDNSRPDDQGNVTYRYANFYYDGLEISTKLYGPYALYKAVETAADNNKITYRCDGSLAKTADPQGDYVKNEPYLDCQTNGKDFLTQYEFSGAMGHPIMTTGGDYGKYWQKIYIKRLSGLNYLFMGSVSDEYTDSWSSDSPLDKFKEMSSREALNEILKNPQNTRKMALWESLVDSFRVEAKDEFGLQQK